MVLYRGDFLRGFSVEGAAPFEDWVAYRREQYHQRAQQMLVHMVNYQLRCRNDDKAQQVLQRQIELEPWNEEAHQQLMRLYSRNGHRSSALIQFENCRRILSAELGVGPSPLTQKLYAQIRDGLPLDEEISAGQPRFWHNLPLATTSLVGRVLSTSDRVGIDIASLLLKSTTTSLSVEATPLALAAARRLRLWTYKSRSQDAL